MQKFQILVFTPYQISINLPILFLTGFTTISGLIPGHFSIYCGLFFRREALDVV